VAMASPNLITAQVTSDVLSAGAVTAAALGHLPQWALLPPMIYYCIQICVYVYQFKKWLKSE